MLYGSDTVTWAIRKEDIKRLDGGFRNVDMEKNGENQLDGT